VPAEKIERVGNIMIDSFELLKPRILEAGMAAKLGLERRGFGVVTLHRPSNVDRREKLTLIVERLVEVAERLPLAFPVHPRTRRRLEEFQLSGRLESCGGIRLMEPLSYVEFMSLVVDSRLVVTDSGGVQEETSYLGIPCLTLRENTERPVTVTEGTNRLLQPEGLVAEVAAAMERGVVETRIQLWDGRTAERVADSLRRRG